MKRNPVRFLLIITLKKRNYVCENVLANVMYKLEEETNLRFPNDILHEKGGNYNYKEISCLDIIEINVINICFM